MPEQTTPYLWAQMRREQFERVLKERPVVVLPIGSIEQHGPHCPVDVDLSIPLHIALEASRTADDFPLVVAPPVPFGFTHYNQGFVGTITLQLETFIALVSDVCLSIYRNGFERLVLLNGHGGNHHPIRAISVKLAEHNLFSLAFSHWDLVAEEMKSWGDKEGRIGHGGEWETSLQLYLRPELVDREKQVAETWVSSVSPEYSGFAVFPERQRETPYGVMGDPFVASAEKGRRYVELAVQRLQELSRAYREQPVRQYRHGS
ncbi:MAG: creatininase family protein [Trueperaceae bacterium]|nr:MAG: creatininase family protein [Trueperaceae bacterium]